MLTLNACERKSQLNYMVHCMSNLQLSANVVAIALYPSMTSLFSIIAKLRVTCGIPLTPSTNFPTFTYYADDSTLLAKSPEHPVTLHNTAQRFCKGPGVKLNMSKWVAIPEGRTPPILPNEIKTFAPGEQTTIPGIPFRTRITREEHTRKVIKRMIERCAQWRHRGRTIKGRVIIVSTVISSAAWYVMSALATFKDEKNRVQRIINKFMHQTQDIHHHNNRP